VSSRRHGKHSKNKKSSRSRSRSRRRDDRKREKAEKKLAEATKNASVAKPREKSPTPSKDEKPVEDQLIDTKPVTPTQLITESELPEQQTKPIEINLDQQATAPTKVIKLSSSSSATPSPSTSPTKKSKPTKRKVFLTQNIYQQLQSALPLKMPVGDNGPKRAPSVFQEEAKPLTNKDVNIENSNGNNGTTNEQREDNKPARAGGHYGNCSNSESEAMNEEEEVDSDFLDINISDNINMTLV
jgi:hypothetical protein